MSRQIEEILIKAPDSANVKRMLPVLRLRVCTFRFATPELDVVQAENILQDLSSVKLAQPDQLYEFFAVRYLLGCFLGREELSNECLQIVRPMVRQAEIAVEQGKIQRNEVIESFSLVNSRLAKVAGVHNLSDDFERFLLSTFPNEMLKQ